MRSLDSLDRSVSLPTGASSGVAVELLERARKPLRAETKARRVDVVSTDTGGMEKLASNVKAGASPGENC